MVYSFEDSFKYISKVDILQTKLMREFRNGAGKMIVVYDYDESVASRSATTLAQRGYDNVLMLSGGLRVAEIKFPSSGIIVTSLRDSRLSEEEVVELEECLEEEEAMARGGGGGGGGGRLSSYAPSVSSSRLGAASRAMSYSQPNLFN